jgi:hypothetical protein
MGVVTLLELPPPSAFVRTVISARKTIIVESEPDSTP